MPKRTTAEVRNVSQFSDDREWSLATDSQDRDWAAEAFGVDRADLPAFLFLHDVRDSRGDVVDYDELWGSSSLRLDAPVHRIA